MFQSLRKGAPFYILYKNGPRLAIGEVVEVSPVVPQFGTTYQNGILTAPKNVVDVKVSMAGEEVTLQKLPAEMTIADFGNSGMVVSESREDILAEVDAFKTTHARALQETDMHQHIVEECDKMLAELNPRLAKEAEQEKEIEFLKGEMADIKALLTKALGRSSKSKEES